MSFKNAEQFVSEMKTTKDLRKSIAELKNSAELKQFIKSNGFEFNFCDLAGAMSSCMEEMGKGTCSKDQTSSIDETIQIDENTKTLIAIGAATAANCIPCIDHYFFIAESFEIPKKHIQEAVDVASKVKTGASVTINDTIENLIHGKTSPKEAECCKAQSSCC